MASIDLFEGSVRKCSDKCDSETKSIKILNFNYTCCDTDYCNNHKPENDKTCSPSCIVEHKTTDRLDSLSSPNNTPSQNDNSLEQITDEITNKLECSERDAPLLKIDRLQRIQVKLTDKLEFFQEHCYQLTEELNKKSKIIQFLS
uniref:Snake toxin/toxin-like domain-containing protein n=1 Tax=Trichobilharzia regenti TaxID=157069 RepID=A0AA85JTE3_TRIRE|nr:unnamed protein product [Trichobilharzia regenti]